MPAQHATFWIPLPSTYRHTWQMHLFEVAIPAHKPLHFGRGDCQAEELYVNSAE